MGKRKPAYWLFYRGFRVPSPFILVVLGITDEELLDKLLEMEKNILNVLDILKEAGSISLETYNKNKPIGSQLGRMYGFRFELLSTL